MISRNNIIVTVCILLIVVAIIQGKFKKPRRIMGIEREEKLKKERYTRIIPNVQYIKGYNRNIEDDSGNLGTRDSFITFFKDDKVKYEDWDVDTRDEQIIIDINKVQDVIFEVGKNINKMLNENLDEEKYYFVLKEDSNIIFQVDNKVDDDFITYIRHLQKNN